MADNQSLGERLYTLLEEQPRDTKAEQFFDKFSVGLVLVGLVVGGLLTVKDMTPHYRMLEWVSGCILATIALEYTVRVWVSGFNPCEKYTQRMERIRFAFKPINFVDVITVGMGSYGIITNN